MPRPFGCTLAVAVFFAFLAVFFADFAMWCSLG